MQKNWKKKISKFFFQREDHLMSDRSKKFFAIFQIFKNFFWKVASMGHKKSGKKQSHEIWAPSDRPLRRHARYTSRGGPLDPPPPCRIGLKTKYNSNTKREVLDLPYVIIFVDLLTFVALTFFSNWNDSRHGDFLWSPFLILCQQIF